MREQGIEVRFNAWNDAVDKNHYFGLDASASELGSFRWKLESTRHIGYGSAYKRCLRARERGRQAGRDAFKKKQQQLV